MTTSINTRSIPLISIFVLFFIFIFCFFGDYFYVISPYELHADKILLSPSFEHIFGTDRLGRDVLARIMEGGQISLTICVGSALIASFVGLFVGISAGFFQKGVDKIIILIIDLFLTFPTFFLLLALISYMNASVWILILVISITGWMGTARLIRSESFAISSKPFIKILKIADVSKTKIIFKRYTYNTCQQRKSSHRKFRSDGF